jgi:molybdenum cofactor guanylyltransferase
MAGGQRVVDVTGVILAGGKSRRMGQDKRFMTVGQATLLDRCCSIMTGCFQEVLIITAQDSSPLDTPGCRVYQDLIPDCGSLGGLYTGLHVASQSRIFVVACDMPFLTQGMMRWFITRDPDADIVIGRLPHGLQPLHAVYAKRVLPLLELRARARRLKIQDIVSEPTLQITVVDPHEWGAIDPASRAFDNVNTPDELEAARTELARAPLAP